MAFEATHLPTADTADEGLLSSLMGLEGEEEAEWSTGEIKDIQRALKKLGLYKLRIDGDLGRGSKTGLGTAFGDDQWRFLDAASVLTHLQGMGGSGTSSDWSKGEIEGVQRELKRLDLYSLRIDGDLGRGSKAGLRTAFGGDQWKSMDLNAVMAHLKDYGSGEGGEDTVAPWSERQIKAIQTELKRLGLYVLRVDGDLGRGTKAGLVEAFGGDQWRELSASDALQKLVGATKPDKGINDNFRYGEMLKDGVLDITLGVGFDENDNHLPVIQGYKDVLTERDFTLDPGKAASLYTQAGRTVENADFGQYYVRENAMEYTPPVGGSPRPIHAVVRLVFSKDGSEGGKAADAFAEGMAESDVAYYGGHGRYGSGPDFDRNMSFELLDDEGKVTQSIDDYHVLQRLMRDEGQAAGRSAWAQFEWRVRKGTLRVNGSNEGNVFLNDVNKHGGEFGSKIMYWNLLQKGGKGAEKQTGKGGPLAEAMTEEEARDYRVLVFNGCRTKDYVKSIRSTPGLDDKGSADVLASTRLLYWRDIANTLAAFLDSIIEQQNKAEVIKAIDDQQLPSSTVKEKGGAFEGF